MEQEGFKHIYQLEGGILKYFEDCQSAHYDGECFVFDQRTGVDPSLHETDSTQCYHCQSPLTAADQADLCWRLRPPVWLRMGLDPCCRRGGRWDGPERRVIVRRKYADNPLQLLATTSSPDSGWERSPN
jgi:hypothetical protein